MGKDTTYQLGKIKAPSGKIFIVDMGLLNLWMHDQKPGLPKGIYSDEITEAANEGADFIIEGPDALEAGKEFNRHWHPLYVWDVPEHTINQVENMFSDSVKENHFMANLVMLNPRIPHRKRVDHVLEHGKGAGEVFFNGITGVAIDNIPKDKELDVVATKMHESEFEDNWKDVIVKINQGPVAKSIPVGICSVDWARLIIADLDSLADWKHEEALDGKADFVFWGRDAETIATKYDAPKIDDGNYGWKDLPVDEIAKIGKKIETESRTNPDLKFATDFRPHSHHFLMMEQLRSSDTDSGMLSITNDDTACAFHTLWGDGFFPVFCDIDSNGKVMQIRIELGSEEIVSKFREFQAQMNS